MPEILPHRVLFWTVSRPWIFYVLAGLAAALFLFGLYAHVSVWVKGFGAKNPGLSLEGLRRLAVDGLLGRRIFQGDSAGGIMHLLLSWGFIGLFIGTTLLSIHHYIVPFLSGTPYLLYSAALEVAGIMLIVGVLWAFVRRYIQRLRRLESRTEDLLALLWLVFVALSGFLVEGVRLAAQRPGWGRWSFVGYFTSLLLPGGGPAAALYGYVWWSHVILSLGLVAAIPYFKMFHMVASAFGIYLEPRPEPAPPLELEGKGREVFSYRQRVFLDACTRCGRCVEVCPPTAAGEPFAPREMIVSAREALQRTRDPLTSLFKSREPREDQSVPVLPMDARKIWHCTTCRACLEVCPVYVATPEAIREVRAKVVEEGREVSPLLIQTLEKLYKYRNPWEASKKVRAKWAEGLDLPTFGQEGQGAEFCYFVGCTTSIETRAQELARSFVRILRAAHVPFAILGKREPCCGDIARRVGEDGLFEEQKEQCWEIFQRHDIKKVVTTSPHCLHTFLKDYRCNTVEGGSFVQARHYSQVLSGLVSTGALRFERSIHARVTYHDPCYLGRYSRIFDDPREVIMAIPGIDFVEMPHCREGSLCCGGGGGRVWQEELEAQVKMSEIRIREVQTTGAQILITACPLCLIMLEDARKTAGLEEGLQVMDLSELVVRAMGLEA